MRTVTTTPITSARSEGNGRSISLLVHREPSRPLQWVAVIVFNSHWPNEQPLTWEVSAGSSGQLIRVLRTFDPRVLMAGIHAGEGQAPPAMEARREQVKQTWLGLVERVEREMGREG